MLVTIARWLQDISIRVNNKTACCLVSDERAVGTGEASAVAWLTSSSNSSSDSECRSGRCSECPGYYTDRDARYLAVCHGLSWRARVGHLDSRAHYGS